MYKNFRYCCVSRQSIHYLAFYPRLLHVVKVLLGCHLSVYENIALLFELLLCVSSYGDARRLGCDAAIHTYTEFSLNSSKKCNLKVASWHFENIDFILYIHICHGTSFTILRALWYTLTMKLYNNHNIKAEEPKSTATAQLKTQRIGNYNGVFFFQTCVFTLYRTCTLPSQNQCHGYTWE